MIRMWFCSHHQGSSKLEKAEILQMTVDHLKLLHAMGGKGQYHLCVSLKSAVCFLTVGTRFSCRIL